MEDVIERLCQNCADLSNNLNMLVVMLREQNKDTSKLIAIRKLLSGVVEEEEIEEQQSGEEMLQDYRARAIYENEGDEVVTVSKNKKMPKNNKYQREVDSYEDVMKSFKGNENDEVVIVSKNKKMPKNNKCRREVESGEEILQNFREKAIHEDEIEEPRVETAKERKTRLVNEFENRRKELAKKRENQFSKNKKKRNPNVIYIRDDVIIDDDVVDYSAPIEIFDKQTKNVTYEDDGDAMLEDLRNEEADKCGRVPLKHSHFKSKK